MVLYTAAWQWNNQHLPVMWLSALGGSKDFHFLGVDSNWERFSARRFCSRLFFFKNLNTWVEEAKKPPKKHRYKPKLSQIWTLRILLSVVTLSILQPLQHVSDWWGDGRALSYSEQVQTVCVLFIQLQGCIDLVTDGVSNRLESSPEGKKKRC